MHIHSISKSLPARASEGQSVFDKIQTVAATIVSVRTAVDAFSKTAA